MTGNYFSHQEDNGTQETLFTQDHPISKSTLFKDRIKLGANYGLYLSPVQIHDDDRTFSCHMTVRPGKILRSSTTVKVFGKSFCCLDSLSSCHPCCLLCFPPREEAACDLECSHARLSVQEFCLLWYLPFMLGLGERIRSKRITSLFIDWNHTVGQFPGDHSLTHNFNIS